MVWWYIYQNCKSSEKAPNFLFKVHFFLSMQDKTLMILELSNVRVQAIASSNFEYMQKMQNAFHKKRVLPSKYIG